MAETFKVIRDTTVSSPNDSCATGLILSEAQVRTVSFILGVGAPLAGALIAPLVNGEWWFKKYNWSYQRLCVLWFISISAFAMTVVLPGHATRSIIILSVIHELVEINIMTLLLGGTASQGLLAAFLFGLVGYSVTFGLKDIAYTYFIGVFLGGTGDFLMPMLLFYGQQPLLAIGSLAHTAAAALVFGDFIHNSGVVNFNALSLYAVWGHVGFIVAGLQPQLKPGQEYPTNPMKRDVPFKVLAILAFISAALSFTMTSFFAFLAPRLEV